MILIVKPQFRSVFVHRQMMCITAYNLTWLHYVVHHRHKQALLVPSLQHKLELIFFGVELYCSFNRWHIQYYWIVQPTEVVRNLQALSARCVAVDKLRCCWRGFVHRVVITNFHNAYLGYPNSRFTHILSAVETYSLFYFTNIIGQNNRDNFYKTIFAFIKCK